MKKIAVVTNTSWNILNFRSSLIKDLQKSYEVLLIAPKDEYSSQIKTLAPTIFLKKLNRKGTNPVTDLKLVNELKNVYTNNKIDLALHFTIKPNIYGSMAAKKANVPSIAVVTGLGYTFLSNGIAAKIAKRLYKHAFHRNNMTVFQNEDDRKLFVELGLVPEIKSRVINGSGIDTDLFSPRKKEDWQEGFHFLFIGRLLYDKGVRELFSAFNHQFKKEENVYLHIVGDIDNQNPSAFSQEELDAVLPENENIIYHGRIDGVQQMIADSDCVVLPSYREGVPRVMLEAMSMAKPIIATDVAGCKETVIEGLNGFLVESQNHLDLSQKMREMTTISDSQRDKMGEKGRSLAIKRFSTKVINKNFLIEIRNIITF